MVCDITNTRISHVNYSLLTVTCSSWSEFVGW